jgi:ompA family protein
MQKTFLFTFFLLCVLPPTQAQKVQKSADNPSRWYVGADLGVSLGGATFNSFGVDKTRVGFGFGVLGGYHINSFLSAEAEFKYTHLSLGTYDCCRNLWLGSDGNRYFAPVAGMQGWNYRDVYSSTSLYGVGLRLNVDFLKLFHPANRWSVMLSPAIYNMGSSARVKTIADEATALKNSSYHFGMGGDISLGYQVSKHINVRLYTGMTYLTGRGMDGLPQTEHKAGYTWDTGVKVTFALSKRKGKRGTTIVEAQPLIPAVQPTEEKTKADSTPRQPEKEAEHRQPEKVIPATPIQPAITCKVLYEDVLYFSYGQSTYIERSQYKTADRILKAVAEHPDTKITIVGWADKSGGKAQNETISFSRAETVKRYLIRKGIAADRITTKGKGVDNTAMSNYKARRVEVKLIITEK